MGDTRKLRVGMVGGGGPGTFFGGPHRRGILVDNSAELTAGALRSNPQGSLESARELHFARGYPDYPTMVREESKLGDERIDYVTVVTPNDSHYPVAKAFIEAGIPVLCEKPLTLTLAEAVELAKAVKKAKLAFVVALSLTGLHIRVLARE